MTYDTWKLASPPEYEEDAPPAQPQAIHKEPPNHRCATWVCWACGECSVCGEHKPYCDSVRQTMEVDPDVAF